MDQLRKLTYEYQKILLLEEDYFLAFKRHFIYIAQKYLKPPTIIENKKLVKLFVKSLGTIFQNTLNLRLSLLKEVNIDKFRKSKVEDLYNLEYIIQKIVELVSGKTIA